MKKISVHKVCPLSAYKKPEFLTELPKSPSLAESLAGQGQQKEPGLGSGTKLVIARLRPGHIPSLRWEGLLASCSAAGRTGGGQVSLWPRKIPLPTAQRVEKGVKVVPGAEGCDLLAGPWPWSHPFCALCTRGEALGPAEGSREVGVSGTPQTTPSTQHRPELHSVFPQVMPSLAPG